MSFRCIRLVLVCFVLAVSVAAQKDAFDSDASRFAGKWVLTEVRQIPGKHNMPLSRDDSKLKIEMEIRVSGNELYVDEKVDPYSRSSKYFLDGSGEKNAGFTAGFVYDTTTKFSDGKIMIERRLQGRVLVLRSTNWSGMFRRMASSLRFVPEPTTTEAAS